MALPCIVVAIKLDRTYHLIDAVFCAENPEGSLVYLSVNTASTQYQGHFPILFKKHSSWRNIPQCPSIICPVFNEVGKPTQGWGTSALYATIIGERASTFFSRALGTWYHRQVRFNKPRLSVVFFVRTTQICTYLKREATVMHSDSNIFWDYLLIEVWPFLS